MHLVVNLWRSVAPSLLLPTHPPGLPVRIHTLLSIATHNMLPKRQSSGTFNSALSRLEHIATLGFTCIELMPITDYGGSWGYNPRSCLALHTVSPCESLSTFLRTRGGRFAIKMRARGEMEQVLRGWGVDVGRRGGEAQQRRARMHTLA